MKLSYDNLLSNFAFSFNLRHYTEDLNVANPDRESNVCPMSW